MPEYIKKRDGRLVPYDEAKIRLRHRPRVCGRGERKGRGRGRPPGEDCHPRDEREGEQRNALRRGYSGSGGARADCRGLRQDGEGIHPLPRGAQPHPRGENPPDAHFGGYHVQGRLRIRCEAREREHRRRYRDGHDAQVRLGERQAVLRHVRAQPEARARRTARATSTSTTSTS